MKYLACLFLALFLAAPAARAEAPDAFETELIRLINIVRTQYKRPPLQTDAYLMEVARVWARHMAKNDDLSHRKNMGLVMAKAGYAGMNENLYFMTYPLEAQRVVDGWMNSPGHKKNLLAPDMELIGVGYAFDSKGAKYIVFNGALKAAPKAVPVQPEPAIIFSNGVQLK